MNNDDLVTAPDDPGETAGPGSIDRQPVWRVFDDPTNRKIARELVTIGESPAAFFRDACRLADNRSMFETSSHLLGHLMREIESGIRQRLIPLASPDEPAPGGEKGNQVQKRQIEEICRALGAGDGLKAQWISVAQGKGMYRPLHAIAHRKGLNRPREFDVRLGQQWVAFVGLLAGIANAVNNNFLRFAERARELALVDHPSKPDIDTFFVEVPPNPVLRADFFSRVSSPGWIEKLLSDQRFDGPEDPVVLEDGSFQVDQWPPSVAIARLSVNPEFHPRIARLVNGLAKRESSNWLFRRDLIHAAVNIPASSIEASATEAILWTRSEAARSLGELFGDLAVHVARGGNVDLALALLSETLAFEPRAPLPGRLTDAQESLVPEPVSRIHDYAFELVLEKPLETLAEIDPVGTARALTTVLSNALGLQYPSWRAGDYGDYSVLWRPAIPGNGPEHRIGPKNSLISALYSVCRRTIEQDGRAVDAIVTTLEGGLWTVLRRMAIQIIADFPEVGFMLASDRACDSSLLLDYEVRGELYAMVKSSFGFFPPDRRREFFRILNELTDSEDGSAQFAESPQLWLASWLSAARPYLSGQPMEQLEQLEKGLGYAISEPRPEFEFRSFVGPTSPVGVNDLAGLPPGEVARFLSEWEPPGTWDGESPHGLGRILEEASEQRAQEFSREIQLFRDLDATYIRGIVGGLSEAARKDSEIAWTEVLAFSEHIVALGREIADGTDRDRRNWDPDRGWARKEIARLLFHGLQPYSKDPGREKISIQHRGQVWRILEVLVEDPDPAPGEEIAAVGELPDGVLSAINTVRGEAIRAAIRYGLWVFRSHGDGIVGDDSWEGFSQVPELRTALDRHLDPLLDPAYGPRAVYGLMFPSLHLLDEVWAKDKASRIFDSPGDSDLPRAAWDAYIRYCQPYDVVAASLDKQYRSAIDRIGSKDSSGGRVDEVEHALLRHLLFLFLRAAISPEKGGLLAHFFDRSSPVARREFLSLAGRHFQIDHRSGRPIRPEERERLQGLFEGRERQLAEIDDQEAGELSAIGDWFIASQFGEEWCMERMGYVLDRGLPVEPEIPVLAQLVETSQHAPASAVSLAARIVKNTTNQWAIGGSTTSLSKIISTALDSGDPDAQVAARYLANRLVAKGYLEFESALEP